VRAPAMRPFPPRIFSTCGSPPESDQTPGPQRNPPSPFIGIRLIAAMGLRPADRGPGTTPGRAVRGCQFRQRCLQLRLQSCQSEDLRPIPWRAPLFALVAAARIANRFVPSAQCEENFPLFPASGLRRGAAGFPVPASNDCEGFRGVAPEESRDRGVIVQNSRRITDRGLRPRFQLRRALRSKRPSASRDPPQPLVSAGVIGVQLNRPAQLPVLLPEYSKQAIGHGPATRGLPGESGSRDKCMADLFENAFSFSGDCR